MSILPKLSDVLNNNPVHKVVVDMQGAIQTARADIRMLALSLHQDPPPAATPADTALLDIPTEEETKIELKRRLLEQIASAEDDLVHKLKINGKPCTCLTGESLIYTGSHSVLPISQIYKRRTKYILTHKGISEISEHMSRDYSDNLCQFKFAYNTVPLRVTPEHPFLVAKDGWKWNWRNYYGGINEQRLDWVAAADIGVNDFISFPRFTRTTDMGMITSELAEIFGWYLAEGTKCENRIGLHLGYHEKENIEHLKHLFKKTFGKEPIPNEKETVLTLDFADREFTSLFEVFGQGAENKRLPDWCLYLPFSKQGALLRGLFKGDGCLTQGGMSYGTVSTDLAHQIRFILFRLGIIHGLYRNEDVSGGKIGGREIQANFPVYQIKVYGDALERLSEICDMPGWQHIGERKPRNHGWVGESTIFLPIRSVDQIPFEGRVYNMAVLQDESYLTPYGASHNCLDGKHNIKIISLAREIMPKDPNNPLYTEIIDWWKSHAPKLTAVASASGRYDEEYVRMAGDQGIFRRRIQREIPGG